MKEEFNTQKSNKTSKNPKNSMNGGAYRTYDQINYDKLNEELKNYENILDELKYNLVKAKDIYEKYDYIYKYSWMKNDLATFINKKNEKTTDEDISNMVDIVNNYNKKIIESRVFDEVLPELKRLYYKNSWF